MSSLRPLQREPVKRWHVWSGALHFRSRGRRNPLQQRPMGRRPATLQGQRCRELAWRARALRQTLTVQPILRTQPRLPPPRLRSVCPNSPQASTRRGPRAPRQRRPPRRLWRRRRRLRLSDLRSYRRRRHPRGLRSPRLRLRPIRTARVRRHRPRLRRRLLARSPCRGPSLPPPRHRLHPWLRRRVLRHRRPLRPQCQRRRPRPPGSRWLCRQNHGSRPRWPLGPPIRFGLRHPGERSRLRPLT